VFIVDVAIEVSRLLCCYLLLVTSINSVALRSGGAKEETTDGILEQDSDLQSLFHSAPRQKVDDL
jgi:hypothetical protein